MTFLVFMESSKKIQLPHRAKKKKKIYDFPQLVFFPLPLSRIFIPRLSYTFSSLSHLCPLCCTFDPRPCRTFSPLVVLFSHVSRASTSYIVYTELKDINIKFSYENLKKEKRSYAFQVGVELKAFYVRCGRRTIALTPQRLGKAKNLVYRVQRTFLLGMESSKKVRLPYRTKKKVRLPYRAKVRLL